jgi:hypothetical protein
MLHSRVKVPDQTKTNSNTHSSRIKKAYYEKHTSMEREIPCDFDTNVDTLRFKSSESVLNSRAETCLKNPDEE